MTSEGPYESGYPRSDGYPPESDPAGPPPRHRHTGDDDVPPPPGMPGARAAVRMPDGLRAEPPGQPAPGGAPGAVYGRPGPAQPSVDGGAPGPVYGRPGPAQPSVDGGVYQSGGHSAQGGNVYGGQSGQGGVYGQPSSPAPQPGVYGTPGGVYGSSTSAPPATQGGTYGSSSGGVYGSSSAQSGGAAPSTAGPGPSVYGTPRPGPAYAAPDDVPPPRPAVSPMPPPEAPDPRVYGRPAAPEAEMAGPNMPQQRSGGSGWADASHDAMGGTIVDANLAAPRQPGVYGRPASAPPAYPGPDPAGPPAPGPAGAPGAPAWPQPQQPPQQYGPGGNAPVGQPVYGNPPPPAFEPVPPPAKGGRGLRKFGYIGIAVLVVGAGVGALYYTSRPNPPSYSVGSCVRQAGDKAESATCGSVGSYRVVSRVADRTKCPDPTQPIIQLSSGDAATRVVCLVPAR